MNLKKGILRFYVVISFVLVYGIIVLIFPKERKFEYEFKSGAPWMHEDLIAEYDFPILKSDAQIKEEQDSMKRNFIPYFVKDSSVSVQSIDAFQTEFQENWDQLVKIKNKASALNLTVYNSQTSKLIDSLNHYLTSEIQHIYEVGLLEFPDSLNRQGFEIFVLDKAVSYAAIVDTIYHLNEMHNYLLDIGNKYIQKNNWQYPIMDELLASFQFDSYLQANLIYDEAINENLLTEKLEGLSIASGLVQKGELIIQQGGIVNDHSYVVLTSLKKEYEANASITNKGLLILGISLIYLATAFALFMFLLNFKPKILNSFRSISFVLLQVLIFTGLAMLIDRNPNISIYVIPFVIVPMMVQTFFDDRTALFVHIIVIMMAGFVAPNGFEFVFIELIAGIVAVFTLKNIQQRKRMFITAFYVLITYAVLFFSIQIMYNGGLPQINWMDFVWFVISAVLMLFSILLIWVYEKIFGFISDATLMELTDTNHPLLRKLAEKAPGTFQHSMQVANLAEAVGRVVGGNPLLIRTGALYHDIGKSASPEYFVENQSGFNPHDKLEFDKSAEIIISHVTRGVEMAKKANLPDSVIDFIRTHHGIGKAQYFYRSYLNKYPDKKVDESKFTYPGPSPQNIENAILMMADSIEAATRTLKEYTEASISKMVSSIIDAQLAAGQFNHVDITLKKISEAKAVFTEKLLSIYHTRIEYPEVNKTDLNKEDAQ